MAAAVKNTGIFTAPTAGTYYFAYSGISTTTNKARVQLQKNITGTWSPIATAYSSGGNFETFALDATLKLGEGDEIRLFLMEGAIYEYPTTNEHFTHFVGILLEEELV